ncbi:hypothetical protein ABIE78_000306 [Sinorhizobium fredii]
MRSANVWPPGLFRDHPYPLINGVDEFAVRRRKICAA